MLYCFRKFGDATRALVILITSLISLTLFASTSHSEVLEYFEYHCSYGSYKGEPNCDGDGSGYSVTHYVANLTTKTVAINQDRQHIMLKEKGYYYEKVEPEMWSMCEIADAKNFLCRKSDRKDGGYEIYQLAEGKVISCSYCIRHKAVSQIEYYIKTKSRRLSYQYCAIEGDINRKCPL